LAIRPHSRAHRSSVPRRSVRCLRRRYPRTSCKESPAPKAPFAPAPARRRKFGVLCATKPPAEKHPLRSRCRENSEEATKSPGSGWESGKRVDPEGPIGRSIVVHCETEDPRRMLREMADEVEVDQKFRQLVTNAAPAIVLSKENPSIQRVAFEWTTPRVSEKVSPEVAFREIEDRGKGILPRDSCNHSALRLPSILPGASQRSCWGTIDRQMGNVVLNGTRRCLNT
jgi:hypothetical protein